MSRLIALTIVLIITALGVVFLCLDILDIAEDFRIHLLSHVQLAIIIAAPAVIVVYLAARSYVFGGPRSMLWLGCGALAFGAGIIIRGWLSVASLNVPITILEISLLLASLLHLTGGCLSLKQTSAPETTFIQKPWIIIGFYMGVLVIITLITLLAYNNVFPPFYTPGTSTTLIRSVLTGTTIILVFVSSVIYLRLYSRRQTVYLYWYSLGLMLFTLGLFFLSQGSIESRLYWLGEVSLFAGGIYFLVTVAGIRRLVKSGL